MDKVVLWVFNALIAGFGVFVLIGISSAHKRMLDNRDEARNVYETIKGKPVVDIASGMMGMSAVTEFQPENMDYIREKYNKNSTMYFKWTQMISIFPLMGLLGTVIGLIPGLNAVRDGQFDLLYTSLSTALYSTLIGLICSIVLKLITASYSSTISDIEDYFEENDRKYNMALNLNRVKKDIDQGN